MTGSNTKSSYSAESLSAGNILFEDNHIIIVNKLPSQIVQGDKTGDVPLSELVKAYLKEKYNKPGEVFLGVVHRLDRPVSGAVIFARTSKSLSRLNALLKNHEIKKTYWAVVKNQLLLKNGFITDVVRRDNIKNKSLHVRENSKNAQKAILSYSLLAGSDNYFLLEINLKTGRHHQIRAQLAGMGCPIKGDLKYGYPRSNNDGSIHLHARKLEFIHPVTLMPVSVIADPPLDPVWNYFLSNSI